MSYPKFIKDRIIEFEKIGNIEEIKIWKELNGIDEEIPDNITIIEIDPLLTAILQEEPKKKRGRPKKGEIV